MVLGARKAAQGAFVTSTAARDHDRFTLTLWIRVEAATELTYLVRGASRLRFANNTEGAAWISISQVNAQKRGRSLNAAAEWEVEGSPSPSQLFVGPAASGGSAGSTAPNFQHASLLTFNRRSSI